MSKTFKLFLAAILLPLAAFFWHSNWPVLSSEIRTAYVSVDRQASVVIDKTWRDIVLADKINTNEVVQFLGGASAEEIGAIDTHDPVVKIALILTRDIYNMSLPSKQGATDYPEGMTLLVATGATAEQLSDECGCYGLTSGNVSIVFAVPGVNVMHVLSHEVVHQLQYNRYGIAMWAMPRILVEYQAEVISRQAAMLLAGALKHDGDVRITSARTHYWYGFLAGGTDVKIYILIGASMIGGVVLFLIGKKVVEKVKSFASKVKTKFDSLMTKVTMAEESVKDALSDKDDKEVK